jgi:hypothetical protein
VKNGGKRAIARSLKRIKEDDAMPCERNSIMNMNILYHK